MTPHTTEIVRPATGCANDVTDARPPTAGNACASCLPLWARPAAREVLGDTLRPGGFLLTDRIATLGGMRPGWRVLDMGCGTGATMLHLRQRYGALAFGCDRSTSQIASAKDRGLPAIVADAGNLPFSDESMDMVLCECVLSLLENPLQVLRDLHRLLVPGGLLGVSDLYLRGEGHAHVPEGSCLAWQATRTTIESLLQQAGFTLRTFEDHSSLLRETAARLALSGALCDWGANHGASALPPQSAGFRCPHGDTASTRQGTPYTSATSPSTLSSVQPSGTHVTQPTAHPGYFLLLAQSLKGTRED